MEIPGNDLRGYRLLEDQLWRPNEHEVRVSFERLAASGKIDGRFLRDAPAGTVRGQWYIEQFQDRLAIQLERFVARWDEPEATLYLAPLNWWEHLKHRFWPLWAKQRWGVKYYRIEAVCLLPEVPRLPDSSSMVFRVFRHHFEDRDPEEVTYHEPVIPKDPVVVVRGEL